MKSSRRLTQVACGSFQPAAFLAEKGGKRGDKQPCFFQKSVLNQQANGKWKLPKIDNRNREWQAREGSEYQSESKTTFVGFKSSIHYPKKWGVLAITGKVSRLHAQPEGVEMTKCQFVNLRMVANCASDC